MTPAARQLVVDAVSRRGPHPRRQRRQASAAAPPRRSPGRETTTKCAMSSTCGIAAPGVDFCERVGAGDEENLRRRRGRSRAAAPACRRCSDGPVTPISRSLTFSPAGRSRPARPSRSDESARRAAGAAGAAAYARRHDSRTRSSASARRAASAVSMWPACTGSNVPPRIPRRVPSSFSRRSSGRQPSAARRRHRMPPSLARRATSRQTASSSASRPCPVAADTG